MSARNPLLLRILLLPTIYAFACAPSLQAQLPSTPDSCSQFSPSKDDIKEKLRQRVYPKAIIDDVSFEGSIHLPAATLEELVISLKEREVDSGSKWLEEIIEEMSVRGAWQDQGYFKVEISAKALPLGGDANYQHFSVTFHVDEGLQYRVGSIRFRDTHDFDFETKESAPSISLRKQRQLVWNEANSPDSPTLPIFPVEDLRKLIPLEKGDILSVEKVREGLEALRKLYGKHGYIDFTATPFTDVDDEHQLVSLRFELDEQMQYRIGKIEVIGLDANTENALIWKIKPGDIFNTDLFEAFFKDNQSILPAGASDQNSVVRRNTKDGIADIKFVFYPCPRD
jgi:outer membrane protein assembly factor BamA